MAASRARPTRSALMADLDVRPTKEAPVSHPFILTLSCKERPGIVHAVSSFLFEHGCDIVEHQQFDDAVRGQLFLLFEVIGNTETDAQRLAEAFRVVADEFGMSYRITGEEPERI